jgi:hypothetical protein
VQKIHEARKRLAALDRELMALARTPTAERGRILQERLKAFLELLELLELGKR